MEIGENLACVLIVLIFAAFLGWLYKKIVD